MIKNIEKVKEAYQKKVDSLIKIRDSKYPPVKSQELYEAHKRKVVNANNYLEELDSIGTFLCLSDNIIISSMEKINEVIENAEYSSIEFEGEFVKLYLIQKFGYPDMWLLYLAPLKLI